MKFLFGRLRKYRNRNADSQAPLKKKSLDNGTNHPDPNRTLLGHLSSLHDTDDNNTDMNATPGTSQNHPVNDRLGYVNQNLPFRRHASLPKTFRSRFRQKASLQSYNADKTEQDSNNQTSVHLNKRPLTQSDDHERSSTRSDNQEKRHFVKPQRSKSFSKPTRKLSQQKNINVDLNISECNREGDSQSYNLMLHNCQDVTVNICAENLDSTITEHCKSSCQSPLDEGLTGHCSNRTSPVCLLPESERTFINRNKVTRLTQESIRIINSLNSTFQQSDLHSGLNCTSEPLSPVNRVLQESTNKVELNNEENPSTEKSLKTDKLTLFQKSRECQTSLQNLTDIKSTNIMSPENICCKCKKQSSSSIKPKPVGTVLPVLQNNEDEARSHSDTDSDDVNIIFETISNISSVPSDFYLLSDSTEDYAEHPVRQRRFNGSRDDAQENHEHRSNNHLTLHQTSDSLQNAALNNSHNNIQNDYSSNVLSYNILNRGEGVNNINDNDLQSRNNRQNSHMNINLNTNNILETNRQSNLTNDHTGTNINRSETTNRQLSINQDGIDDQLSRSIYEKFNRIQTAILSVPGVLLVGVQSNRILVTISPQRQNIDDITELMSHCDVTNMEYDCVVLSAAYRQNHHTRNAIDVTNMSSVLHDVML